MHMYNLIGLRQVYVRSVFNICEGNESLLRWFQTQDSIGQTSLHRILFGYMLPWEWIFMYTQILHIGIQMIVNIMHQKLEELDLL